MLQVGGRTGVWSWLWLIVRGYAGVLRHDDIIVSRDREVPDAHSKQCTIIDLEWKCGVTRTLDYWTSQLEAAQNGGSNSIRRVDPRIEKKKSVVQLQEIDSDVTQNVKFLRRASLSEMDSQPKACY